MTKASSQSQFVVRKHRKRVKSGLFAAKSRRLFHSVADFKLLKHLVIFVLKGLLPMMLLLVVNIAPDFVDQ